MAERFKLFQKLVKDYPEAYKEKKMGTICCWKCLKNGKKLKDSDLKVTLDKKISELSELCSCTIFSSQSVWYTS